MSSSSRLEVYPGRLNDGLVIDGRYRVLREIGRGGMGAVYEVEQIKLEKRVALKVLQAGRADSEGGEEDNSLKRFVREARAASAIKHRNVVDIIDFGDFTDGSAYYVMELLRGKDLSSVLKREQSLSWPRAKVLLRQVLSALAAAHEQSIIHRDIKPANIMLLDEPDEFGNEWIKVLDFGIAKVQDTGRDAQALTGTSELLGTAAYMGPEVARGERACHRTDLYAVGVVAFELLTGTVPFTAANTFQVLLRHINDQPPRPSEYNDTLTPAIDAFILHSLAKQTEDRYVDASAMLERLDAIDDEGMMAGPIPALPKASAPAVSAPVPVAPRPTPQKTDLYQHSVPLPSGLRPPSEVLTEALSSTELETAAISPEDSSRRSRWPLVAFFVVAVLLAIGVTRMLSTDAAAEPKTEPAPASATPVEPGPDEPGASAHAAAADVAGSTGAVEAAGEGSSGGEATADSSTGAPNPEPDASTETGEAPPVEPTPAKKCTSIACRQRSAVKRIRGSIRRRCRSLATGGSVKVKLTVGTAGEVLMPRALAPHDRSALGKCVIEAVAKGRFPASNQLRTLNLEFRP
ncbi:MAG: protein kinase [Myxococcota bacterium]